jgi:hypothetical protein
MSQADRPLPFQPRGAMDGFVVDSTMAKNMSMCGRWGSSCGIPFDAEKFFDEHRQWITQKPFIDSRPTQPWTDFKVMDIHQGKYESSERKKGKKNTKSSNRKRKNMKKHTFKNKNHNKKLVLEEDEVIDDNVLSVSTH